MRGEGLFRTLQPRRFGGGEADIAAFFDKQIEISATDMSTGWLAGVMGVLAFHLALFPAKAQTDVWARSEEHTSELQSLMRISYAVLCLKKKQNTNTTLTH